MAAVLQSYWLHKWFSVEGFWDSIKIAIPNLLLLQSFMLEGDYYYSYNAVSWYLCDLLFMYFMTPFFVEFVRKKKNPRTLMEIGVLFYLLYVLIAWIFKETHYEQAIIYISPIVRSIDFFEGVLLGELYIRNIKVKNYRISKTDIKTYSCIQTGTIFLLVLATWLFQFIPRWAGYSVFYLPIIWLNYFVLFFHESYYTKILSAKIFELLSRISLELYLLHQLIIRYLDEYERDIGCMNSCKYYLIMSVGILGGAILLKKLKSIIYWGSYVNLSGKR